ncbi:hypothetical protein J6590_066278 [Homalodisca vitripennis]|nr:hypothetical protein J6590_066278 [Homalodisca vitripennis]
MVDRFNSFVPWLTPAIRSLMAQRDSLYRRARRTNDPDILAQSRQLRNRVKQDLRDSAAIYSHLNSGEPIYLADKFKLISETSARETRMASSILLIPRHRTSTYNKSFVVTACRAWNSLPNHIKSVGSRNRFAALLKAKLLETMSAMG